MFRKFAVGVVVAAALVCAGGSASAQAVTCSGSGCTGQDPAVTGCSADGQTWATAAIKDGAFQVGTVEIRWSPTCKTNWTRAVLSVWTENVADWNVTVELNDGRKQSFDLSGRFSSGATNWSDMIYAPVELARASSSLAYVNPATLTRVFASGTTVWVG